MKGKRRQLAAGETLESFFSQGIRIAAGGMTSGLARTVAEFGNQGHERCKGNGTDQRALTGDIIEACEGLVEINDTIYMSL